MLSLVSLQKYFLQVSRGEFGMKWSRWHIGSCEHKSLLDGLYFRRGGRETPQKLQIESIKTCTFR